METTQFASIVVSLVIGAIAGAAIAWTWSRQTTREQIGPLNEQLAKSSQTLESERAIAKADVERLQGLLREETGLRSRYEGEITKAEQAKLDALTAKDTFLEEQLRLKDDATRGLLAEKDESVRVQLAEKQKSIDEQKRLLAEAEKKLGEVFEALSSKTLKSATDEFMKLAETKLSTNEAEAQAALEARQHAIDEVVKPLKETLEKLDEQQRKMEEKRTSAYDGISTQIENLLKETGSLSNALRRPAVRGNWGEITLRTVADNAGLIEGQDYELQTSFNVEDGRLRPDMIVRLPNQRALVIDSKVPMEAYRAAVETENPDERRQHLDRHCRIIRDHINNLSSKSYWSQIEGTDYVLMFLPTEAMYHAAIEHDADLINFALGKRVIPANPLTLVCALRAVAHVLDIHRLNQNAAEIKKTGQQLYDGILTLGRHVGTLGNRLRLSVEAYNDTVGSLERNVLSKARQLKEKGLGAGQDVPEITEVSALPSALRTPELVRFSHGERALIDVPEPELDGSTEPLDVITETPA